MPIMHIMHIMHMTRGMIDMVGMHPHIREVNESDTIPILVYPQTQAGC